MNDDFLKKLHKTPRKQFAADLYQRISQTMSTPKASIHNRFAYGVLALLVALTALSFSPVVRVMARDFLQQIGIFNISDRPAGDPVLVAPPSTEQIIAAQATSTPLPPQPETASPLEAAITRAGFLPYLPAELPAGYEMKDIVTAEYIDDLGTQYGKGIFAKYESDTGARLEIQTSVFDGRKIDMPAGGQPITEVDVNGQPGVWIEDFPSINAPIDMLIWEENGFYIAIQSDHLPLDEVLKLAASLSQ
jgi:hypothetical protein